MWKLSHGETPKHNLVLLASWQHRYVASSSLSECKEITFECEYYDVRVVTLPRNQCSYEMLYWSICEKFQLEGVTIMHGDQFIDSQQELDALLSDERTHYSLLLYDLA